jgi:iron complex outermembrane receptor protein
MWTRTASNLSPEEQSGFEGGIDVILGGALTFQVTRYDQTASGLIQRVMISADTAGGGGRSAPRYIGYQSQNVGEITNRGWELQGSLQRGPFTLSGTLASADSRVRRLATGYTGDLSVGDRMLDVPARTLSATAAWSTTSWYGSITAYRAANWISYDRLSLVRDLSTPKDSGAFMGRKLRDYWIQYPGVTHLQATFGHSIRRGLLLTVTGENLLDMQRGEPDNATVLPGRTISVGVQAEF